MLRISGFVDNITSSHMVRGTGTVYIIYQHMSL